ncbi:SUMF1/EgtB/PvdO family nonheme iron enzyme [Carboxylicivirga sediminis]|uniref:SUMF1/EgtB/PvdO family nonheme iron enzyme n=1 Tax=Carboxylicivirga sediminis TaxID=2006564 RepID=A0A941IWZ1_9BACT|nr:SUMF1/EgtB/PvdO family nonheme iron enzyme [Carboxylicivirga sediminis]MBR8535033.1 SUMF1/EgtB/PvdO family nonheme iron enzyme [Carboxylicivirga sediminis]
MKKKFTLKQIVAILGLIIAFQSGWSQTADKVYMRAEDWASAVLQTKARVQQTFSEHNLPFSTDVVRKGEQPRKISLNVSQLKQLVLITWGTKDGTRNDHSAWVNAKLITKSGETVWLDEMKFKKEYAQFGHPTRNQNKQHKPIIIAGKQYDRGIYTHGNGELIVELDGQYDRFEAEVGIENLGNKSSSVIFKVQNITTSAIANRLSQDFPEEMRYFLSHANTEADIWLTSYDGQEEEAALKNLIAKLEEPAHFQKEMRRVSALAKDKKIEACLQLFKRVLNVYSLQEELEWVKPESIQLAVENMKQDANFDTTRYTSMLKEISHLLPLVQKGIYTEEQQAFVDAEKILSARREILLANPLLDMDRILVVRHKLKNNARIEMGPGIGTQSNNWSGHNSQRKNGFDCEITELSNLRGQIQSKTIYKPDNGAPVSDLQLHWDADRLLFTTVGDNDTWQLFEVKTDGTGLHQVTQSEEKDLNFFDGTYLPNGKILAVSNIGYHGVPCVSGNDIVGNICLYDPKTHDLRRLNFGQDNDWDPIVMNNGRVMYLRWEYTDNTHYFSRIMMHMNPDGTNKKELYGSGSYWPNSMFDAQPLPGKDNTQFIAIVSGHHGIARSGRLVLFDPKKGRQEEKGVVQEIPYRNKYVVPEIKDRLVDGVWPQFLKPRALSKEYFLVTAKMSPESLWGLYLVDIFDNVTPIVQFEGEGITEATPVHKKTTPPVIPEKVNLKDTESTIYIQDIYEGAGTKGVPRGTIKELRIIAYEFAYIKSPSGHMEHGIQSGWDIKRVLGTVPVEDDGSVIFKVPANMPITIQPLDGEGAAVQLMRSWLTGMPGEVVSCVGCHENQNTIAKPKFTIASKMQPRELTPPFDGVRAITFEHEIQPILNKRCVACHDGKNHLPDFKDNSPEKVTKFGKSYLAFHPFINRQGPEADIYVMKPMEYHANTSDLVQMLKKGHHNVELSDEEWQTLYRWIDCNAPYNGVFNANEYCGYNQVDRRQELMEKYNNVKVDWKGELHAYIEKLAAKGEVEPVMPPAEEPVMHQQTKLRNWPFSSKTASRRQNDGGDALKVIELAPGVTMKMVRIPSGSFVMGSENGDIDEYPRSKVKVKKAFWMGAFEVTNEQYTAVVPEHDSRYIAQFWKDHVNPGYPANMPNQPVIRISWEEAMAFCDKLSEQLGMQVSLPTEAQWEWAARSGSEEDFWFGESNTNFSSYANLADKQLANMAVIGVDPKPMSEKHHLRPYFDFIPRSKTVDDGNMLGAEVGQYEANPWGLYDMIGNVAEWTRTDYAPYPYKENDGRNAGTLPADKVARGGSWRDRPEKASSSHRKAFKSWQKVYNVGFRIVIEE